MKNVFAGILAISFSNLAMADLEIKKYVGSTATGAPCEFEVKTVSFQSNMPHPLNERAEILFQGQTYTLAHPGSVNLTSGAIGFNHDVLQSIQATPTGAISASILMSHEGPKQGPTELKVTTHNWKTKEIKIEQCLLP